MDLTAGEDTASAKMAGQASTSGFEETSDEVLRAQGAQLLWVNQSNLGMVVAY